MNELNRIEVVKVAILDMYKGAPNQGMRNVLELLEQYAKDKSIALTLKVYDVRNAQQVPDLSYDIYISTGGPGSPIEIEGWEEAYLNWFRSLMLHNQTNSNKKHAFLICHSFQVICYHFKLANVCQRKSESFGIFPIFVTDEGLENYITAHLCNPFYAVDSRKWQVIEPNLEALTQMGAHILAIEKERPHVPLERATMAIQFTPEIIGTQFHPEADAEGMIYYLNTEEKKNLVIENYGLQKYTDMLTKLHDPEKVWFTQQNMIPVFLDIALHQI